MEHQASGTRSRIAVIAVALSSAVAISLAKWFELSFEGFLLLLVGVVFAAIFSGVLVGCAVSRSQQGLSYSERPRISGRGAGTLAFAVTIAVTLACAMFVPPRSWPTSVRAAVDVVINELDAEDRKTIAYGEADPLYMHFGLGMWIRNEFGLWGGNHWLRSDCGEAHPDHCSGVILAELKRRLRSELPAAERLALEKLESQMTQIRMESFNFHEMSLKEIAALINDAVSAQLPPSNRFMVRYDPGDADETVSWSDPGSIPFPEALVRLAANTHIKVLKKPPDLVLEPDLRPLASGLPAGAILTPLRVEENGLRTERRELISDEKTWSKNHKS